MLLRNFKHAFVLEQWRASATQWAVGSDVDALALAEIDNFLLRQKWVVLDLVDGGCDGSLCEQLLHVLDRVVGNANSLDLVRMRLDQFFQGKPCVDVSDGTIKVSRAVFELGE